MAKKKTINVSSNEIQKLIQEAIGEIKLRSRKGKDGVFSTDDPRAAKAVRDDVDAYDDWYGESWSARKGREDLSNLIDKRSRGEDAELELGNYPDSISRDRQMEKDVLDNEKAESDRYDRPYGDLDDTENMYFSDPSLESDDEEEMYYESRLPRRVSLNERQLREFISYSVAQILRESLGESKPIYSKIGGEDHYEGEDDSLYGPNANTMTIELGEDELSGIVDDDTLDELYEQLNATGNWPVKVKVGFTVDEGTPDTYDVPGTPDEAKMTSWEILGTEGCDDELVAIVQEIVGKYMETEFDIDDAISEHMGFGQLKESSIYEDDDYDEDEDEEEDDDENFGGGWDASFNKRVSDGKKKLEKDLKKNEKNRGTKVHFPGKPKESTEIAGIKEGRRYRMQNKRISK